MKSRRGSITGAVYPIVTPFIDDPYGHNPIDWQSLEEYIEYLLKEGAKCIMVASATSRFSQLTVDEIDQLNAFVKVIVKDRAKVIASTPIAGTTKEHIYIAQKAESYGYNIIACEYPWRYQGQTALAEYFQTIEKETRSINIFLHVTPGRSELGGQYRYNTSDLLEVCNSDRVVGFKEAAGDKVVSQEIWQKLSEHVSVIVAGRASETFIEAFQYGADGFFVGTGNIVPRYSEDIFELCLANKIEEAKKICKQHETLFLDSAKKFGWHASLKTALNIMNLMPATERRPMIANSSKEKDTLKEIMVSCGWL